jgi:Fe-Mn family superoxide dismutase
MRSPKENNMPDEKLLEKINHSFGSFEAFKKEFSDGAKTVEGSGWMVLCKDKEGNLLNMQIEKHNLNSIATFKPILVLDVWEHSYYLDYKNDRGQFVENWWNVVNWDSLDLK